jgi:hypothetical protein
MRSGPRRANAGIRPRAAGSGGGPVKAASVMHFETELPDALSWKFGSLDEAVSRTLRLMIRSVPMAVIHALNEDGSRQGVLLRLEKCGVACPSCLAQEAVVLMSGVPPQYDELAVCRNCLCSFRL